MIIKIKKYWQRDATKTFRKKFKKKNKEEEGEELMLRINEEKFWLLFGISKRKFKTTEPFVCELTFYNRIIIEKNIKDHIWNFIDSELKILGK